MLDRIEDGVFDRYAPGASSTHATRQPLFRVMARGAAAAVGTAEGIVLSIWPIHCHWQPLKSWCMGFPTKRFKTTFVIRATIPKKIIQEIDLKNLPRNWRDDLPPAELRELGDRWLNGKKSAALKVPSGVIPVEFNYVLIPCHKDFGKIETAEPLSLAFDKWLFG